jgi:hypothetical protein
MLTARSPTRIESSVSEPPTWKESRAKSVIALNIADI